MAAISQVQSPVKRTFGSWDSNGHQEDLKYAKFLENTKKKGDIHQEVEEALNEKINPFEKVSFNNGPTIMFIQVLMENPDVNLNVFDTIFHWNNCQWKKNDNAKHLVHLAVMVGRLDIVKKFVEIFPEYLNEIDTFRKTPFDLAVRQTGQEAKAIVGYLLQQPRIEDSLNRVNFFSRPFLVAAGNNPEIACMLLQDGRCMEIVPMGYSDAFRQALGKLTTQPGLTQPGLKDTVFALRSCFIGVLGIDSFDVLAKLYKTECQKLIDKTEEIKKIILSGSSEDEKVTAIKTILEKEGAFVNAQLDSQGNTLGQVALDKRLFKVLKLLIEYGACFNRDENQVTKVCPSIVSELMKVDGSAFAIAKVLAQVRAYDKLSQVYQGIISNLAQNGSKSLLQALLDNFGREGWPAYFTPEARKTIETAKNKKPDPVSSHHKDPSCTSANTVVAQHPLPTPSSPPPTITANTPLSPATKTSVSPSTIEPIAQKTASRAREILWVMIWLGILVALLGAILCTYLLVGKKNLSRFLDLKKRMM